MSDSTPAAPDAIARLLSDRIRQCMPKAVDAGGPDWNFGSKAINVQHDSLLEPFDALQLRWRLLEANVSNMLQTNMWAFSGHAHWAGRQIDYTGCCFRHVPSGAFLSFKLDLLDGDV